MATLTPWLRELSPDLTRSQLLSYLKDVLQFATTNIKQLDRSAKLWSEDLDPYVSIADKVIVETALLVLIASRVPQPSEKIRVLVRELVHQLSPMIRTNRNRALLMRYPYTAAALGIGHIILTNLGDHDEEFDDLVKRAFASGHVETVERLPYRSMDVQWLRGLIYPSIVPDFDDLLPHSILTSHAHPIHMSVSDFYALTHALMYVTDFGVHPLPSSVDTNNVRSLVDAALAYHLLSENLDLLGELLMSVVILGSPWSPYTRFGWCLLTTIWNQLGFVPSPTFDASVYSTLAEKEASSYAFRHLYHTMYVYGMLCGLLLHRLEDNNNTNSWMTPPWNHLEVLNSCDQALSLAIDFCQTQQPSEKTQGKSPQRLANEPFSSILDRKHLKIPEYEQFHLKPLEQADIDKIVSRIQEYSSAFGSSTAPWTQALPRVPLNREELALVLTDALLIHASQDYRIVVLAELLSLVASLAMPLSDTFREAVAFMIRQQMPNGAIGAYFAVTANRDTPQATDITAGLARHLALIARRLESEIMAS